MEQPRPYLESKRLVVRAAELHDAAAIARYYRENREHFRPYEPLRADVTLSENFWQERIPKMHETYDADRGLTLFLFPRAKPDFVCGEIGYSGFSRGPFQACYLGYSLAADYQGKGVMSEALRAANHFMFTQLKLHRIMANYMPSNERSARLLTALGFVIEGQAKDYLFIQGRWEDHILTSLISP